MTALKQALNSSVLMISVVLLMACGNAAPTPVVAVTGTATIMVANSTPTIPRSTPSSTPTATPTIANKIRLYHNQMATRTIEDHYSFSVVLDKDADFIPKSIQIIEQGTGFVIGQYELFDQTKIESLCANLMQNPDLKFYETPLIDHFKFPQGFINRAYEGKYIFRISVEYSSGALEIIERVTPDDGCDTHVS